MPWGWCMYTLKYFVFLCTVSSNWHTTIVAYVWYVVTLQVRDMLTFSTHCWCSEQNLWYYWSRTLPVSPFCDPPPPPCFPSRSYLLYKHFCSIYIWSDINQHPFDFRFYIDVCSLKSNCHACIFCVLYGVFELFINKIIFYLKDMFVWGTKGSFELMRVSFFVLFFPVCGRACVCMPNKKLHIFKAF